MRVSDFKDYRDYLKCVLEDRTGKNARYSLRAFARDLRISPQMLSFVLNGKKGLSAKTAAEFGEILGLDPEENNYFLDLVSLAQSRGASARSLAQYRLDQRKSESTKYDAIAPEVFRAISDWHHYAILELSFVEGFSATPKWIAKRLDITTFQAAQALNRLRRLGLLEPFGKSGLRKSRRYIAAFTDQPSSALRKLARQLLEKAIQALEAQSLEERDLTNITMAIDPERLPEAKRMIADFRDKLCAYLEQGKRTEVYVFAPSLFRVSQKSKERK